VSCQLLAAVLLKTGSYAELFFRHQYCFSITLGASVFGLFRCLLGECFTLSIFLNTFWWEATRFSQQIWIFSMVIKKRHKSSFFYITWRMLDNFSACTYKGHFHDIILTMCFLSVMTAGYTAGKTGFVSHLPVVEFTPADIG